MDTVMLDLDGQDTPESREEERIDRARRSSGDRIAMLITGRGRCRAGAVATMDASCRMCGALLHQPCRS